MQIKSVVVLLGLAVCFSSGAWAGELTVAVAANVQYPFEELQAVFQKETGITVSPVIGSSGKFAAQIENGAPFDVFMSADMQYPQALEEKKLTYGAPKIYAYGALVLWTLNEIDVSEGLQAVNGPQVHKIAIASPTTAPYGKQAVNALRHENLYDAVEKKLVYGESVAQTNQFITTQAADVGITSKSTVLAPNMIGRGTWVEVPKDTYEPIAQGVVILKQAEAGHLADARKFFDFVFSDTAKEIFKKYGYVLP